LVSRIATDSSQRPGACRHSASAGDPRRDLPEVRRGRTGRFTLPVARTFPLADIAEAHRISENGRLCDEVVLLVG
jgi:hypothetical protein